MTPLPEIQSDHGAVTRGPRLTDERTTPEAEGVPSFVSVESQASQNDLPSAAKRLTKKPNTLEITGEQQSRPKGPDEKLKKLLSVFHRAKRDFHSTAEKSIERTTAAKFLRDTVENCLNYIEFEQGPGRTVEGSAAPSRAGGTINHAMLSQLKRTLAEATAIAERGSGGKKRRFDENWDMVPQQPAKMRDGRIVKPASDPEPVPQPPAPSSVIHPYSVTRYHPRGLPDPVEHRSDRTLLPKYRDQHCAGYRQREYDGYTKVPQRRRSLSPSRVDVRYAQQLPLQGYGHRGPIISPPRIRRKPLPDYGDTASHRQAHW